MKIDLKRKALEHLASANTAKSQAALTLELERIKESLSSESHYEVLDENLDLLNNFSFRVHEAAASILDSFISRLRTIHLTYLDSSGWPERDRQKYQNKETLTIKAIEGLMPLRYLEIDRVFDTLMELSVNRDESIRQKAIQGLEETAKYNLDVFYGHDQKGGAGSHFQNVLISRLETLPDPKLSEYLAAILAVVRQLLSTTMESTTGNYQQVTWTTANVPDDSAINQIRRRCISILKRIYRLNLPIAARTNLIESMTAATRERFTAPEGDSSRVMTDPNAVEVLRFFESLIPQENLAIIQKIEHDSFWTFYHAKDSAVLEAALVD